MKNELPKRKNIRIPKYNYSKPGYYFITMCTQGRKKMLSKVIYNDNNVGVGALDDPKIELTQIGYVVDEYIKRTNKIYRNIKINDYIIMPNHIHMICVIEENENGSSRAPTPTNEKIPQLIGTIKRLTNRKCKYNIWQRNYYEHVIRNEDEYLRILEYIQYNPLNWIYDKYY